MAEATATHNGSGEVSQRTSTPIKRSAIVPPPMPAATDKNTAPTTSIFCSAATSAPEAAKTAVPSSDKTARAMSMGHRLA